ncbi:rna family protein, partial [Cystoisospora suis]
MHPSLSALRGRSPPRLGGAPSCFFFGSLPRALLNNVGFIGTRCRKEGWTANGVHSGPSVLMCPCVLSRKEGGLHLLEKNSFMDGLLATSVPGLCVESLCMKGELSAMRRLHICTADSNSGQADPTDSGSPEGSGPHSEVEMIEEDNASRRRTFIQGRGKHLDGIPAPASTTPGQRPIFPLQRSPTLVSTALGGHGVATEERPSFSPPEASHGQERVLHLGSPPSAERRRAREPKGSAFQGSGKNGKGAEELLFRHGGHAMDGGVTTNEQGQSGHTCCAAVAGHLAPVAGSVGAQWPPMPTTDTAALQKAKRSVGQCAASHARPIPAWLRGVAPHSRWLEAGSGQNEVATITAAKASQSFSDKAHDEGVESMACLKTTRSPTREIKAVEVASQLRGRHFDLVGNLTPSPLAVEAFKYADVPDKSSEEESGVLHERLRQTPRVKKQPRSTEWRETGGASFCPAGHDPGRLGAEGGAAGADSSAITGETCGPGDGLRRTGLEKSKVDFISSRKNVLIKHIMRLKRRSDLRRSHESIVVVGYPLIRFMCSPRYRRFLARQEGSLVLPEPAEQGGEQVEVPQNTGLSRTEAPKSSTEGKPVDDAGNIRFDLLLTDNPAMAGMPSAFKLNTAEAKCTYTGVMEFLTARKTPRYSIKKPRRSGAVPSQAGNAAEAQASTFVLGGGQGMSLASGSKRVLGCLRRPRERFDFGTSKCILALDCIKYVWNVGILVRNAAVLGFDGIYYVDGTADPFNWKVMVSAEMCLRSFIGRMSQSLPLRNALGEGGSGDSMTDDIAERRLRSTDLCSACAVLVSGALQSHNGFCCILGNESHGPSPVVLRHCTRVALPMSPLLDSLNVAVAGGIVMYELKKLACAATEPCSAWARESMSTNKYAGRTEEVRE